MPQQDRSIPAKCSHCRREMSTPLFCDYCETVNPIPAVTDHFQLLGLSRRYELDPKALHDSYVALSRHAHPDFHAGESPEVRSLSMTVSSALNDAYRTLSDPLRRAGYLLGLLGGSSSADDKSVPDGFLGTMMMMQEELADARRSSDKAELERLRKVLSTQKAGLTNRVRELFAELDEAVSCEATRGKLLGEIRRQLNAAAYVSKLVSLAAEEHV